MSIRPSWLEKNLFIFAIFGLAIYATYWVARLPESLCTSSPFPSTLSGDRIYRATLLKKVCNNDLISYSLKIEKLGDGGWFMTPSLDDDAYPGDPVQPLLTWDADKLSVVIHTKSLSGPIMRHDENLTFTTTYIADRPARPVPSGSKP